MNESPAKDLYAVLGVARDAPAHEIRRAYRRLARQHHPDLNEQPNGPEQFVTLAHAYEILNDPAQRARYDRARPQPAVASQPARFPDRQGSPIGVGLRRGILELSSAEAFHVARAPLTLHDVHGHTLVLPAGTRHGDQITVRQGRYTAILTVRTRTKT